MYNCLLFQNTRSACGSWLQNQTFAKFYNITWDFSIYFQLVVFHKSTDAPFEMKYYLIYVVITSEWSQSKSMAAMMLVRCREGQHQLSLSAASCVFEMCVKVTDSIAVRGGMLHVHSLSVNVRCLFRCKPITHIAAPSQ